MSFDGKKNSSSRALPIGTSFQSTTMLKRDEGPDDNVQHDESDFKVDDTEG